MNKRLTNLNEGKKKPPHHVGEDRDGEDIPHVTNWNKRIYSNLRLHFDYTSTKKQPDLTRLAVSFLSTLNNNTPLTTEGSQWKKLSQLLQRLPVWPFGWV